MTTQDLLIFVIGLKNEGTFIPPHAGLLTTVETISLLIPVLMEPPY